MLYLGEPYWFFWPLLGIGCRWRRAWSCLRIGGFVLAPGAPDEVMTTALLLPQAAVTTARLGQGRAPVGGVIGGWALSLHVHRH